MANARPTGLRVASHENALARPRVHRRNRLRRILVALPLVGLAGLLATTQSFIAYVGAALLFLGAIYILPPKGAYTAAELAEFESPSSSVPTTEELIAAEAEAAARLERQQAELNDGQRHLADLEALNASTEQQLVLDEPQPYAQLGQSPFRDHFVPLEQRVLRPDTPLALRTQRSAQPLAVAQRVEPKPASDLAATESVVAAPKLLK